MIDFSIYKSSAPTMKPNRMRIPVNNFSFNDDEVKIFNEIYQYCLENSRAGKFKDFVITKSGGISVSHSNIRGKGPMWELRHTTTCVEIVIRNFDMRYYRFQIGYNKSKKNKDSLSGHQAFWEYVRQLELDAVDLTQLAIENGQEVKATIPKPMIAITEECKPCETYSNVHHIDLNSAYNAGMMLAFPVLEKTIRRMYQMRKINPRFKDILNMTQGVMQSKLCGYRYAHISKSGYVFTNRRINELTENLKNQGFKVLAFNTDGIWYQSPGRRKYHDEEEGTDIGQWKHDHVDCTARWKSAGSYEFIDGDGVYYPVVRGQSSYERIVPREEWVWGDIFKGHIVEYKFLEGEGIVHVTD